MKSIFVAAVCCVMLPTVAFAELTVGSPFTDQAVLQRDVPVPVWGKAKPDAEVTVEFAGQKKNATASTSGSWKIVLDPMPASFDSRTLTVHSTLDSQHVSLSDVLVGEVWICSGQSNMQMGFGSVPELKALAPKAKNIRTFSVKRTVAFTEQDTCEGAWAKSIPDSAVAFGFAHYLQEAADVPVGIILTCWGSSSLEGWLPAKMQETLPHFKREVEAFEKFDRAEVQRLLKLEAGGKTRQRNDDIFMRTRPSILYNAMMHPIAPYAARGLVWYQGEANTNSLANMRPYGTTLPAWCQHLRELWGKDDFQFLAVMLPGYGRHASGSPANGRSAPNGHSWAWFRESQRKLLALPNTGIANTIDLGDMKNIHPRDKEPIGKRLSLLAQKQVLGQDVVASGPTFEKMEQEAASIRIHFQHAKSLRTTDGKPPREFWVAGKNRKWQQANATLDGDSVLLRWEGTINPDAVRYAFAGFPDVNLVNGDGLPAMPFRTDADIPPGYNDQPSLVADKHRRK